MSDQKGQDAVLASAKDLFTTKGFASTSVREICDRAGVTPPVLYYHFGSKEGLFEAVVAETVHLDDFGNRLRQAVERAADPWEKLRVFFQTYLEEFPVHLLNPGLHFQCSTELHADSLRQMGPGIEAIHETMKGLLQAGIAAGDFRSVDADVVASCLLGLVDSFVRARVYLGLTYDVDRVGACVVDLLLRGLTNRSVDRIEDLLE